MKENYAVTAKRLSFVELKVRAEQERSHDQLKRHCSRERRLIARCAQHRQIGAELARSAALESLVKSKVSNVTGCALHNASRFSKGCRNACEQSKRHIRELMKSLVEERAIAALELQNCRRITRKLDVIEVRQRHLRLLQRAINDCLLERENAGLFALQKYLTRPRFANLGTFKFKEVGFGSR